ncbi:hypothetical protein FB45DRAFT_1117061 [Roridomyces roridus]|uniref:Uncharacterized protein n=1 Tax=Roridomyces roridus TaxID=1738132 RepID=A0AAD7FAN7_9AGAR|nr:hypothetical protein FB45DRAFT_1117061 [Roridomyces roridus]
MHRFFQIPELVELLCSHVNIERRTEWEPTKNAKELVTLARTSSVFSHAISLIWSSVTLENLLQGCLPADSFETTEFQEFVIDILRGGLAADSFGHNLFQSREFTLKVLRPLRDEDFERILFYAPHIKFLSSFVGGLDFASVFQVAGDSSSWFSRNKLPNLRGICWEHFHDQFPYIEDFLSPELTMISIPYLSLSDLEYPYSLANRFPQLRDVTFPTTNLPGPNDPEGAMEQMNSAVSACLRGLHFLQTLVVHELDHEAFRHASCLLEWCIDIPLTKLFIYCIRSTPDETHRLFVAAAGGLSHTSMRSFSFYGGFETHPNHHPDHATQSIRAPSLRQLFCFANITRVTIQSDTGVDLDDNTVEDMARSWRRIERLELLAHSGNRAPRASVGCLRAFAEYCPNLVWLCMTFDARLSPSPGPAPLDVRQKSLESLIVATSPTHREAESAQPIAEFMAAIFPSLKHVSVTAAGDAVFEYNVKGWERAYPSVHVWREVKSLLQSFAEHRARV